MKLKDLIDYKENEHDDFIFNFLTKSSDSDIINYISKVTSDLLKSVFLTDEFFNAAKNNIKNYTENDLAELALYMVLTPYVQNALKDTRNWQEKSTSFLECYIGYIIGTIDKNEFLNNLAEMQNLLKISDKFYNGLITYFKGSKDTISNNILNNLNM